MCGRYTLTKEERKLQRRYGIIDRSNRAPFLPRYNICPTQQAPVLGEFEGAVTLRDLRWGLIPFWAKDEKIGSQCINAKSETVAEKPAFRAAFKKRRCLVLSDGFFEWMKIGGGKQPVWITRADGEPFCFAGLWEFWRNPEEQEVRTFTILTTAANELLRPVHSRMPVVLDEKDYDLWLDSKVNDTQALLPLLKPYPSEQVQYYPVSTIVNNPRNDLPQCIERLNPALMELDLQSRTESTDRADSN